MQELAGKKIVLGVCGGIAAYKSAYLCRELIRAGAEVRVVMTCSAHDFIRPLVFQALTGHPVGSIINDPAAELAMGHIELARWADILLIAPATANMMAKMAHGLADDLLSTLYLATKARVLVCPAMNEKMWLHPATEANRRILIERGVVLLGPAAGEQACGDNGPGRMLEPSEILRSLAYESIISCLKGQKVLITAGPTYEAIDPVRFLGNRSSGKMGYALAEAAAMAGAEVTLISGPSSLETPWNVNGYKVESAAEMEQAVMEHLEEGMIFIGAAAVADYSVSQQASEKLKKNDQPLNLQLKQNPDIIAAVAQSGKPVLTIGFAAETQNVRDYAREKMKKKGLDMILANTVGKGQAFDQDENHLLLITPREEIELGRASKSALAAKIIAIVSTNLQNSPF